MGARDYPIRFTPRGLCDALDATDRFPGACTKLQNLIFDPANPEQVISRPGVTELTAFAGFTTPGVVSVQISIGTRIYGMIATGLTAGAEEPFCYETATNAFIAISGVTAGNAEGRPTAQATTGAWTPPQMAVIGSKIIITHAGYSGAVGKFFGVIDISVPATPAYTTANTAVNLLPSVPTGVANYNNRAYFICKNVVYYSDVLVPGTMTNAGQALTVGDTTSVIALSGLAISTSSAGSVAGLLVFKEFQIWQITGDAAVAGSLSLNYLSLTIGTSSPRSIAQSPLGVYFATISGPYIVNPLAAVSPVVKGDSLDSDVQLPFQGAAQPTRIAGGYLAGTYRVCIDTFIYGTEYTNDYWFDEHKRRWTGPHSFSYDSVSQLGHYFILSSNAVPGKLFKSEPAPDNASVYLDNGSAIAVELDTSFFPKTPNVNEKQVIESTMELSSAGVATTYYITAMDEAMDTLDSTFVSVAGGSGIWGSGTWGDGQIWVAATNVPRTYTIPWGKPLVFKKLGIKVTASATSALSIGTFYGKYQDTGYTNKG